MGFAVVAYVIAAIWVLLFLISFTRERRRLRNGVYLFMALAFLGLGALATLATVSLLATRITVVIIIVLIPLTILALAAFLIGNGVTMIRREGARLPNLLSLLLGAGIVGFVVLSAVLAPVESPPVRAVQTSVTGVLGYFSFLFVCFLLYAVVYGRIRNRRAVDFVVVLGSGLIGARVPPLLASRLDRARVVLDRQHARGAAPLLITSGGRGCDEDVSESRAMADYLIDRGVPSELILLEDRSRTTFENMTFSRELMAARRPGYRCLVVTNNFHVLRAALTARRARVNGQVIGSPTAWYFWPSATIREFVAIVVEHRVVNGAICVVLVLPAVLAFV
ncbi:YdcF family protein [Pseudonocardia sp. GCM10023141]|uniref:YdcF family protein n=1 Tax=Pseudonocardia sp. GCM10023141 TaxID=3252653 RepID=UPI003609E250